MKHRAYILLVLGPLFACTQNHSLSAKDPGKTPLRKGVVTISTSAKTTADLPVCDQAAVGVQSFVAEADRYLVCDGNRWRGLRPGSLSGRFEARDPVRFYEWEDRASKKRWRTPIDRSVSSSEADKVCEKGWELPSLHDVRTARDHGLFAEIKARGGRAFAKAWTKDFQDGQRLSETLSLEGTAQGDGAGVYCVGYASHSG